MIMDWMLYLKAFAVGGLICVVGQLLISLTGVDTQAEVSLDGLIELGGGDFLHHCERLKRSVGGIADLLDGSAVSLGMLCHDSSFRGS